MNANDKMPSSPFGTTVMLFYLIIVGKILRYYIVKLLGCYLKMFFIYIEYHELAKFSNDFSTTWFLSIKNCQPCDFNHISQIRHSDFSMPIIDYLKVDLEIPKSKFKSHRCSIANKTSPKDSCRHVRGSFWVP